MTAIIGSNSVVNTPYVRAEATDPLSHKVARFAILFFLGLGALILAPVTLVAGAYALICRHMSSNTFGPTIDALGKSRFVAVKEAIEGLGIPKDLDLSILKSGGFLHDQLKDIKGTTGSNQIKLAREVYELDRMMKEAPSDGTYHDYMQTFRAKLNETLALPAYQMNKEKGGNFYINFLQVCAHTLSSEASGMDAIEAFGKGLIPEDNDLLFPDGSTDISYGNLADEIQRSVDEYTVFKKNGVIEKIFWVFAHPEKAAASIFDHMGLTDPLSYNSYEEGNAAMQIGRFKVDHAETSLSLAPTPVTDRLVEADLQYLHKKGAYRIQQDLEHKTGASAGETGRIVEKEKMAKGYKEEMIYLLTPIDYKKGTFEKNEKPSDFAVKLKSHITIENSDFSIPENTKTDEVIEMTKKSFESVGSDKKVSSGAQLLAFDTFMGVETIIQSAKKVGIDSALKSYMNQACKQDIDRGVLVNVMSILVFDALAANKPITKERVHQVIGIVLIRAGMVDDRAILQKRLTFLVDLLKVIGEKSDKFFGPIRARHNDVKVEFIKN